MNAELISALEDIEKEKGISKDYMLESVEAALAAAYKRDLGTNCQIKVHIDRTDGSFSIYQLFRVVDEVYDENLEMTVEEARTLMSGAEPGDTVQKRLPDTQRNFGRVAVQTAKQVIVQRLREAERGIVYSEFSEKSGEVVSGMVTRIENGIVFLDIDGTEAVMPPSEQIASERYHVNDRFKVYVMDVKSGFQSLQITVSRSHPWLVRRLFETEVPEIQTGIVRIRSISREAGQRSKIAVESRDPDVDPIGACVGQHGSRVEHVVSEIRGEKVDIIRWSADPAEYIGNALSPARVISTEVNMDEKSARVIVPDNQLSLAIGKEGQNARLAARLTGWKIDIKSQSQAEAL